jgi:predicted Fe-Mo cluster-binding NifX family protein
MKIAIPTRGLVVDDHFGHCESFTLYSIGPDKNIEWTESLPSGQSCGCKSDIASVLRSSGVTLLLAGNMGQGAYNILNMNGIEVIRGCSGPARDVVELYLKGNLSDSSDGCHEHHGHHEHGAGHQCTH